MPKGLGSWPNAPLVLTIAEVAFADRALFADEAGKLGVLQQSGTYPLFSRGKIETFAIDKRNDGVRFETKSIDFVQYQTKSKSLACRVFADKLAFFDADYSNDFSGFVERLTHLWAIWSGAAPGLAVQSLRLRTLDVAIPEHGAEFCDWLLPSWCAGSPGATSTGLAMRDTRLGDGTLHVRVRNGIADANEAMQLAPDLGQVPVQLAKELTGPFRASTPVIIIDCERVLQLGSSEADAIASALSQAHGELKEAFTAVLQPAALHHFQNG